MHSVRIIVISQSKQLHRNVQEVRQIAPGGNVVGKTGWNKLKQRLRVKESEYRRPLQQYIYILTGVSPII